MAALLTLTTLTQAHLTLHLESTDATIAWTLHHGGQPVAVGDVTGVHVDGHFWTASLNATAAWREGTRPLLLQSVNRNTTGTHPRLGPYNGVEMKWRAQSVPVVTWVRLYSQQPALVVFGVGFPEGANGTRVGRGADAGVATLWPAVRAFPGRSRVLSWRGEFVEATIGRAPTTGAAGGPAVFYGDATAGAVVGSAFNEFKTSSAAAALPGRNAPEHAWLPGVAGSVASLPPGFEQQVALVVPADGSGVTGAVAAWGSAVQRVHRTEAPARDRTVTQLEIQTDNGAQLCFCTEGCDDKLLATKRGLDELGLSAGTLSFQGGWWSNPNLHTPHCAPWCVSTWEPNRTKGYAPGLAQRVGLPFQLYAPYLCMDTPYGAKFPLIASDPTLPGCHGFDFKVAAPAHAEAFFTWFMGLGVREYNMSSFETDFLHQVSTCTEQFLTDVGASALWMRGMDRAARRLGLVMQWCMATPTDALQAVSLPSVTNLRCTTDFFYGNSWDVGASSLLLWALGFAPSKDTFWTSDQRDIGPAMGGCPPSGCPADHSNAGARLHTMLATLTAGPVGVGDAPGRTNGTLLRAALHDGGPQLVQPSRALLAVDPHYGGATPPGPAGHVLGTHCGDWEHLFVVHQLTAPYTLTARDFYPPLAAGALVVREWSGHGCANGTSAAECGVRPFDPTAGLAVSPLPRDADPYEPRLLQVSRRCPGGWALLGDLHKFAPASPDLFARVECRGAALELTVRGGAVNTSLLRPCGVQAVVETHQLAPGPHRFVCAA